MHCTLCEPPLAPPLWSGADLRVIEVETAEYPGYARVIWREHVTEMTDLTPTQRERLLRVVWCIESVQRRVLQPDKINLASLGNQVSYLHWHVIPRWRDDPCFPDAIWAAPRRTSPGVASARAKRELARYRQELVTTLQALASPR